MTLFANSAFSKIIKESPKNLLEKWQDQDLNELNASNDNFKLPSEQVYEVINSLQNGMSEDSIIEDEQLYRQLFKRCIAERPLVAEEEINELLSFGFKFYQNKPEDDQQLLYFLVSKLLGTNIYDINFRAAVKTRTIANQESYLLRDGDNLASVQEFFIIFIISSIDYLFAQTTGNTLLGFNKEANHKLIKEILIAAELYKTVAERELCFKLGMDMGYLAQGISKRINQSNRVYVLHAGPAEHAVYICIEAKDQMFNITIYNFGARSGRYHQANENGITPAKSSCDREEFNQYLTDLLKAKYAAAGEEDEEWDEILYRNLNESEPLEDNFVWPSQSVDNCVSYGYSALVKARLGSGIDYYTHSLVKYAWEKKCEFDPRACYVTTVPSDYILANFSSLINQPFLSNPVRAYSQKAIRAGMNHLDHPVNKRKKITLVFTHATNEDNYFIKRLIKEINLNKYSFIKVIDGSSKDYVVQQVKAFAEKRNIEQTPRGFQKYLAGNPGWLLVFTNVTRYDNIADCVPQMSGYLIIVSTEEVPNADYMVDLRDRTQLINPPSNELKLSLQALYSNCVITAHLANSYIAFAGITLDQYSQKFNKLREGYPHKSNQEIAILLTLSEMVEENKVILQLCLYFDRNNCRLPAWFLDDYGYGDTNSILIGLGVFTHEQQQYYIADNIRNLLESEISNNHKEILNAILLRMPKYNSSNLPDYLNNFKQIKDILYTYLKHLVGNIAQVAGKLKTIAEIIEKTYYFLGTAKCYPEREGYKKLISLIETQIYALGEFSLEEKAAFSKWKTKLIPDISTNLDTTIFSNWYSKTKSIFLQGKLPNPFKSSYDNYIGQCVSWEKRINSNDDMVKILYLKTMLRSRALSYFSAGKGRDQHFIMSEELKQSRQLLSKMSEFDSYDFADPTENQFLEWKDKLRELVEMHAKNFDPINPSNKGQTRLIYSFFSKSQAGPAEVSNHSSCPKDNDRKVKRPKH